MHCARDGSKPNFRTGPRPERQNKTKKVWVIRQRKFIQEVIAFGLCISQQRILKLFSNHKFIDAPDILKFSYTKKLFIIEIYEEHKIFFLPLVNFESVFGRWTRPGRPLFISNVNFITFQWFADAIDVCF